MAAGLLSSVLGIGGGIVMIPVLTLLFNLPQKEAIATSLLTIFFITGLNVFRFQAKKAINWKLILTVVLFSATFSMIAAYLAIRIPEKWLLAFFVAFIVYLSVKTFRLGTLNETGTFPKNKYLLPGIIGSLSGFIAGFAGVGGGAITTPLLLSYRLSTNERVVPDSNAIMMITSAFGCLLFAFPETDFIDDSWRMGYIHVNMALALFLGAVPFALTGSHFQHLFPLIWRKTLLAAFLILIGIRMAGKLFILL